MGPPKKKAGPAIKKKLEQPRFLPWSPGGGRRKKYGRKRRNHDP